MKQIELHEFPLGEDGEWFVARDGDMVEAIDGSSLTGERAEHHYRSRGPYVKVSESGKMWVVASLEVEKIHQLTEERDALQARLEKVAKIVQDWQNEHAA